MNDLRTQLHAARNEYRSTRYPGDLADLLPAPAPVWSRWKLPSAVGGFAAAAASLVLFTGIAFYVACGNDGSHRWQAMLPSTRDLPRLPPRTEMAGAVKTITPPQVPELLMDAKQPLVSSGKFIVNIGKDLAHHADALFHMG